MYEIRILEAAIRDLRKLDPSIARRIAQRINWLAENLDNIQRERLTGDLAVFYKFRIGAYRVLYEVIEDESVIVIHQIGHRREIYR
jgi:mRNA interferase RelE/StbE